MIYDIMKKPQAGDLFWWENPLEKKEEDYDTHLLCGSRPVLIINATPSSFSFIPCTSQIKKFKQIHIIDKYNSERRYNLKDQVLTETDDSRLGKFIGSVTDRSLQFVKAQIGANITNPYIRSTVEYTPFIKIPVGKICRYEDDIFLISSRMGNEIMGLIPLSISNSNDEESFFLNNKETSVHYKVNFEKFIRIPWFKINQFKLEILGSVSKGVLDFINWKVGDNLLSRIEGLQSKISELNYLLSKSSKSSTIIKPKVKDEEEEIIKVDEIGNIIISPKEPLTQSLSSSLSEILLNNSDKIEESIEEDNNNLNESDDDEDDEFKEASFTEYYKPINESKQLLEIHSLDDLMERYYETPNEYIKRTGNTINNYRIFMDCLVQSIDWDKIPEKFFLD